MDKQEYQRQYYQRNKERMRARKLQWQRDNWEKAKKSQYTWRENNKEKFLAYMKNYRATHK